MLKLLQARFGESDINAKLTHKLRQSYPLGPSAGGGCRVYLAVCKER